MASASELAPAAPSKARALIVGARGYSGLELARLLLKHPNVELLGCFATTGFRLADYLPERAAHGVRSGAGDEAIAVAQEQGANLVFLATPFEASARLAPTFLEMGLDVIDLSGAYRLKADGRAGSAAAYAKWYACAEHPSLGLVQEAEYGLVPFVGPVAARAQGAPPRLIANPGCYATAALMAIVPLLRAGLIDPASIAIDGKSGTTGAGRKAEERLMHAEVQDGCLAYKPGRHQHEPEIQEAARAFGGTDISFSFAPHLLDVRRGIVASVYAKASAARARATDAELREALEAAYAAAFAEYPLVEHGAASARPDLLNLRRAVGSARAQIAHAAESGRIYSFCLIDNLMKGAASQAVENMNRLLGLSPWTGLLEAEGSL